MDQWKDPEFILERSRAVDSDLDIPSPSGLNYRPFQKAGIEFMVRVPGHVLNGDDMGNGKTIQATGVINYVNPPWTLIIVPASLISNWVDELRKWLVHDHEIWAVRGKKRVNEWFDAATRNKCRKPSQKQIVVVSYDTLKLYLSKFRAFSWDLTFIDEVHFLKSLSTQRTRAILTMKGIKGKTKKMIGLTGTPLERPIDIYPIIKSFNHDAIGKMNKIMFGQKYCGAWFDGTRWNFTGHSNRSELGTMLRANFMIRRSKEQVLHDLPEKVRRIVHLPQDPKAARVMDEMTDFDVSEILKNPSNVSSYEGLSTLRRELGESKVKAVVDYVRIGLLSGRKKCVLFCHHKSVLWELQGELREFNPVLYHGGMDAMVKDRSVKAFKEHPECRLFIGNLQAAGVGLTLTVSDWAVITEPSWKANDNFQAEDRVYRMGQNKNVLIEYLVFRNSLDDKILKKHFEKWENIEEILR